MALVRCRQHGPPKGRVHSYDPQAKEPAGGGLVCGIPECLNDGVVWLTGEEARQRYQVGQRIFEILNSNATKLKVK